MSIYVESVDRYRLLLIIVLLFTSLQADIIRFETNTFGEPKPINWLGKLEEIDRATGIAKLHYYNKTDRQEFSLHISRIYSLKIDNQDQVNKSLPQMRQDIDAELQSDLVRPRKVELDPFVQTYVKLEEIKHIKGEHIHIRGTVIAVDREFVTLIVQTNDNSTSEVKIDRAHLLMWIRD